MVTRTSFKNTSSRYIFISLRNYFTSFRVKNVKPLLGILLQILLVNKNGNIFFSTDRKLAPVVAI